MMEYKHILVGLDLSSESGEVVQKALVMKHALKAKVSIVHVVEPLSIAYGGDIPMDISNIQDQIQETAAKHLREFSDYLDIEKSDQHLIFGRPEERNSRLSIFHRCRPYCCWQPRTSWVSAFAGFHC